MKESKMQSHVNIDRHNIIILSCTSCYSPLIEDCKETYLTTTDSDDGKHNLNDL